MTVYAVTRKSDGVEVYRYDNVVPVDWPTYPFATHDHTALPPVVEPPPPEPAPLKITKLAFRNRFSQAEKISFELASLDVPDGSMAARQAAAQMRVWLADIESAQFVDLNYPPTRAGVQAVEDYGLIGVGRAVEVLDTPPTDDEVYLG